MSKSKKKKSTKRISAAGYALIILNVCLVIGLIICGITESRKSLLEVYLTGNKLGYFIGGALWGILAAILFCICRHFLSAELCLIVCGLVGFISPIASIVGGVILTFVSIIVIVPELKERQIAREKAEKKRIKAEKKAAKNAAENNTLPEKKTKSAGKSTKAPFTCEYCDKPADKLISVQIKDKMGTRFRKVCQDCLDSNRDIMSIYKG